MYAGWLISHNQGRLADCSTVLWPKMAVHSAASTGRRFVVNLCLLSEPAAFSWLNGIPSTQLCIVGHSVRVFSFHLVVYRQSLTALQRQTVYFVPSFELLLIAQYLLFHPSFVHAAFNRGRGRLSE